MTGIGVLSINASTIQSAHISTWAIVEVLAGVSIESWLASHLVAEIQRGNIKESSSDHCLGRNSRGIVYIKLDDVNAII